MKSLLVGETNPYGGADEFALYPSPPGCTGHRLCHLILQLDSDEYLERYDRANLCVGKWRITDAREAAKRLGEKYCGGLKVLFGSKVCSAWNVGFKPFTIIDAEVVILPHPSGLNRMWGEAGAFDRARAVLREAGAL